MSTDARSGIGNANLNSGQEPIEAIILRSMNEGVITLECNGTIFAVNPAALRILDLTERQLMGRPYEEAFSYGRDNEPFTEILRRALDENIATDQREVSFTRPDGQTVDLSVTSSFLKVFECRPLLESVVIVFRDISAFKALERVKRKAVNHLSHELKTPLAIIRGSVEHLLARDPSADELQRSLRRIRRSLDRLSGIQTIVEEILHPIPFRPHLCALTPLVNEVVADLRNASSHRSVAIHARVDVQESNVIDPILFRIILESLGKNAIENTPDRGEIEISVTASDRGVLLKVTDTGIGIALADQPFIFEGFHYTQATEDYSSKKPFDFNAGGKGLELLRLKVLSEVGHFTIWFESRRCSEIPSKADHCSGSVDSCLAAKDAAECRNHDGTTFFVLFRELSGLGRVESASGEPARHDL